MLTGRFAQAAEAVSMALIVLGMIALCQPWSAALYSKGLWLLIPGWIGLTIWSHRRAVRSSREEGNPQVLINGHPPAEVTLKIR